MGKNTESLLNSSSTRIGFDCLQISLSFIVLVFAVFIVWFLPLGSGDTYVALAGGRDILNGLLKHPDTWAFTTEGRIWYNQNWGTDVIIFTFYKFFGLIGLLCLKAILLSLCVIFTILAMRKRSLPLWISFLTTAFSLIAINQCVELRANLATLVFVPFVLWLIYISKEKPMYIWFAVPAIVLWSNLHGGFAFGLIMIFLWAGVMFFLPIILDKNFSCKPLWNYPLAAVVSLILSGIMNPFGFRNLMEPLAIASQKEWRITLEWQPISLSQGFWRAGIFLIIVAVTVILIFYKQIVEYFEKYTGKKTAKLKKNKKMNRTAETYTVIYEYMLIVISCIMAVNSIRFIALAIIIISPILTRHILWLIDYFKLNIISYVLIIAVFLTSVYFFVYHEYPSYSKNEISSVQSFFDTMHFLYTGGPPHKLIKFINENKITGNMFADWTWEGFIAFYCKDIELFIGGRAQQVYDIETFNQYLGLLKGNLKLEDFPEGRDIHLIAIPYDYNTYSFFVSKLAKDKWTKVYEDGNYLMYMDASWPQYAKLLERLPNLN